MTSPELEGFAIAFIKDITCVCVDLRGTATFAVTAAVLPAMYCTTVQAQLLRIRVPSGFALLSVTIPYLDNLGKFSHMPHADMLRQLDNIRMFVCAEACRAATGVEELCRVLRLA